jgi:gas vesicle protein
MDITLEKIELVKDRTGVSYKEAKEALEAADGSVVDAIINIEESFDENAKAHLNSYAESVVDKVKTLVKKGNVSKILVKRDDEIILNLPVNIGILGTVIAPFAMLVGVVAAFGTKCVIEVVKDDGTIIDVSEMASDAADYAKEKGTVFVDEIRDKSSDIFGEIKEKSAEVYETAREKSADVYETVREKVKKDDSCCCGDSCCCEEETDEEDEEQKPNEI